MHALYVSHFVHSGDPNARAAKLNKDEFGGKERHHKVIRPFKERHHKVLLTRTLIVALLFFKGSYNTRPYNTG